jgi:hypothetical protein
MNSIRTNYHQDYIRADRGRRRQKTGRKGPSPMASTRIYQREKGVEDNS